MNIKKPELTFRTLAADFIGLLLFTCGWVLITILPVALASIPAFTPIPWEIIIGVPILISVGFIIKWFARGVVERKRVRTLIVGLVFLLFGGFYIFVGYALISAPSRPFSAVITNIAIGMFAVLLSFFLLFISLSPENNES